MAKKKKIPTNNNKNPYKLNLLSRPFTYGLKIRELSCKKDTHEVKLEMGMGFGRNQACIHPVLPRQGPASSSVKAARDSLISKLLKEMGSKLLSSLQVEESSPMFS